MGKYKPARPKSKTAASSARNAIPCIFFLVSAMVLVMLLLFLSIRQ